ncbi:nucleotidyl transferase AbiEii/AbiGii toxin family protein [bacterium]|nr:nucleotidyl transferase AbiEii/AbiGii toxin family protein [bacterium]
MELKNIPASIQARLKNRARDTGEELQTLLTRFALERLLFRLSGSKHRESFVLKGAFLFLAWGESVERPTRDLDLLAEGAPDIERFEQIFRELCELEVESDGVVFVADTVRGRMIREQAAYDGIRINLDALIGKAVIQLQIDVGFGDAVVPAPIEIEFPVLLEFPCPRLRGYRPETVVAEKCEAMVALGLANSRLKDYNDLWRLASTRDFEGPILALAIRAVFERRQTAIPDGIPAGLTNAYSEQWGVQWLGVLNRFGVDDPPSLMETLDLLRRFLLPVFESLAVDEELEHAWTPSCGWQ